MDAYSWIFLIAISGFIGGCLGIILTADKLKSQGRAEVVRYIAKKKKKNNLSDFYTLTQKQAENLVREILEFPPDADDIRSRQ